MFSAESAEMEPPLSGGHTMEVAEPADCRPGTPDALCNAAEQAGNAQGHLEADGLAAADSRDSLGTVDYTRNDTAGTIAESGAVNSIQPQAPNGTTDDAGAMEAQAAPIPFSAKMATVPTPGRIHARRRSRSPRRHEEGQEPFGLASVDLSHQFGFRDATLWCWKCGGWSAGSRRASRLKDPCGFPSKTGADVVHRVSGGYPPEAHVWRSDDVSGAPERIPIIKNPYSKRY